LHLLAVSRQHMVRAQHPIIDYYVHGTGDAFSAAWLALYLCTGDLQTSLTAAGQFVYRTVQRTAEQRQRELQLVPELPWLRQTAMQLGTAYG
jgi:pyridoxal/pyridoxine/pyridoxamine kinase